MPAKQEGRVEQLPSGRWSFRYYDAAGARRRGGVTFETKTEARQALRGKVERVELERAGLPVVEERQMPTLGELAEEYLAQHMGEENTKRTLRERLKYATEGPLRDGKGWKDVRVDRISTREIAAWRARLPERSAWGIHKALRALFNYAVGTAELIAKNPAVGVPNPEPKRGEVPAFASWAEVDLLKDELAARDRAIVELAAGAGLRPEEWIALERADVDRSEQVVHVRRVFVDGELREYGKQERSRRRVPLRARVLEALEALPPRLDTRVLFPGERGAYIDLAAWRRNRWHPALESAGLDVDEDGRKLKRTPYALRHTYATFQIAAGVPLFLLAKRMGTSVEQIDKTYGHLIGDAEIYERELMDTFDARRPAAVEEKGEQS